MLRFFRTLRQRLISENKFSKYLFYAIGEIALVMIGILLALQVNNWNESKKNRAEEVQLLADLNAEFLQNAKSLDSTITSLSDTLGSLTTLMELIGNDSVHDFKGQKLDRLLIKCLNNPYWDRTEFILKELENSGRLSKLTNQNLKTALYQWSQLNSSIEDKDEDANISYQSFLNYLKVNGSLRQMDVFGSSRIKRSNLAVDQSFLLDELTFENVVDDFLVYSEQRLERLQKAKIIISKIIRASDKD